MASRSNINNSDYTNNEEVEEHNDNFSSLGIDISKEKPKKILCIDADTLIYWTLVSYHEDGSKRDLTIENLPELEGKLSEMILGIFNKIENYFFLEKIWVFIRGKNNYRKNLYNLYKSNRPPKHELVPHLYNFLIERFNAVESHNFEAEDFCSTIGRQLGTNCIIAFCDHDLLEVENCIMYDYRLEKFFIQSEKEALWEKYKKLNIGESGDFANFSPSYGITKFLANFHKDMSIEEYEAETMNTYLYCWSDKIKVKNKTIKTPNPEKAEEMLKLAKEIIWLKDVNGEFEQLKTIENDTNTENT